MSPIELFWTAKNQSCFRVFVTFFQKIFRFLENFQIFGNFLDFQKIFWVTDSTLLKHYHRAFWETCYPWETCSWQFLMKIFDDNFWWQFLMTIFDDNFWWQFLMTIYDDNFLWQFLMAISDDMMIHDTWYMIQDTWYMLHDTCYMIHDTWYMMIMMLMIYTVKQF